MTNKSPRAAKNRRESTTPGTRKSGKLFFFLLLLLLLSFRRASSTSPQSLMMVIARNSSILHRAQGRRSRCGRCGGRRTNNMLSLVSKLLNLAVSSQDCTRNDLRRSKIQNFPGGGPPDPLYVTRFARLLHFLVGALRAPLRRLDFVAQKRSPPDQTKIASYGPGAVHQPIAFSQPPKSSPGGCSCPFNNYGFFSHAIFSFVRMRDHLATNVIITQDR